MVGDDVIAQMHAQELARWAALYSGSEALMFQELASAVNEYLVPGMDVGIAYVPGEGRWIASVHTRVLSLASREHGALDQARPQDDNPGPEKQANDMAESPVSDDVLSLMGSKPVGRRPSGRSSGSPARDRRQARSRSNRRGRREQGDRDARHDDPVWVPDEEWNSPPPHSRPRGPHPWSASASSSRSHVPAAAEPGARRTQVTSSFPGPPGPASRNECARALSANRLTWRCLTGVEDEGPGLDLGKWVPRPLDEVQCENIAATVQDMDEHNKLMFLIGFFRFVLELTHQAVQIIATGETGNPAQEFSHDEFEGMSLVQTDTLLHSARQSFREVQMALENSPGNRRFRAWWIRNMIESRYLETLQYEFWDGEVQALHSVLVVLSDEYMEPEVPDYNQEDKDFAVKWWKHARGLVLRLDATNPLLQGTVLQAGPRELPSPAPSESPPGRDDPWCSEDLHQVNEYLDYKTAEDEHFQRLLEATPDKSVHSVNDDEEAAAIVEVVERFEAEQKAIAYQQWEDWVMFPAMNEPATKRPRCRITVSATCQGASSSATMHVPLPDLHETVRVGFELSYETERETSAAAGVGSFNETGCTQIDSKNGDQDTMDVADNEDTVLMQRGTPSSSRSRDDTLAAILQFLQGIRESLRDRVAQFLRQQMTNGGQRVSEQLRLLDQVHDARATNSDDHRDEFDMVIVQSLAAVLQALVEQHLGQQPQGLVYSDAATSSTSIPTFPSPMMAPAPVPRASAEQPEMLNVKGSKLTGDASQLAGTQLNSTCDLLEDVIDEAMQ